MNYEEYEPDVLKKLKETEVEILSEIIRVCEKNKIDYFVNGGTAIGAVRHEGFIPWDDDIDICMIRKDLNRFLAVCKNDLSDEYELLKSDGENDYVSMVVQVLKKGTTNIPRNFNKLKVHLGIFVDIFPVDNVPKDEKLRHKQIRDAWFWGKLLILRGVPHPQLPYIGWKYNIINFLCSCIHYVMVFLHISRSYIFKKCEKATLRYQNEDTGLMTLLCDTFPEKFLMTYDDIYPLKKMKFENIEVNVQNGNDQILRNVFGDYMQLPPIEMRKNHPPLILDFGDEKNES